MIEGDEATYSSISSVDSDTQITLTSAITFVAGERLINLGQDQGAASPDYDGYRSAGSGEFIYADPVDSGTAATENKVTSDSTDGEFGFWVAAGRPFDLHIMNSDGKLASGSETKEDQSAGLSDYNESGEPDTANVAKWSWDTLAENDQDGTGVATQSIHTEWLDNGTRGHDAGGCRHV
jgi:hypothetical protein